MKAVVSVIIPAYNYGRFLAEAIASVRGQTFSRWECIVVDDGSTDDTRDIVLDICRRDRRVVYLHQENSGLSAARNTGIARAQGDYLQFLDADDLIELRKLELQVEHLLAHPDTDIVYGSMRYFTGGNGEDRLLSLRKENRPWMPGLSGKGKEVAKELLRDNIMVVNCPLVRREVVAACGPFDVALDANEDWDYWLRCAAGGCSFAYLDLPGTLALVRHHPGSMSKDTKRMLAAKARMHGKLAAELGDPELASLNREELRRTALLQAIDTMRCGRRLTGFGELLRQSFGMRNFDLIPYGLKLLVLGP